MGRLAFLVPRARGRRSVLVVITVATDGGRNTTAYATGHAGADAASHTCANAVADAAAHAAADAATATDAPSRRYGRRRGGCRSPRRIRLRHDGLLTIGHNLVRHHGARDQLHACQRQHDDCRKQCDLPDQSALGPRAIAAAIENREQPALELRGPRHRQRGDGHARSACRRARDVEQVLGIRGTARAGRQHEVVARALPLGAEVTRADPGERVEPVDRAHRLDDGLHEAVATGHVRQLVEKHDADAIVRPGEGRGRHDQRRAQEPARERHGDAVGHHETRIVRDPEGGSRHIQLVSPACVVDGLGAPRQREYRNQADDVAQQQRQADDAPRQQHPARRRQIGQPVAPGRVDRGRRRPACDVRRTDVDARQRRARRRLRHDVVSRGRDALDHCSRQHGQRPARNGARRERQRKRGDEPGGPHGVARGRRSAHRDSGAQPRQRQDDGGTRDERGGLGERECVGGDHASSLRVSAMMAASRSSSSGAMRAPSLPSSAATASPAEPSKNVCTRCRMADCRALSRSRRGR